MIETSNARMHGVISWFSAVLLLSLILHIERASASRQIEVQFDVTPRSLSNLCISP